MKNTFFSKIAQIFLISTLLVVGSSSAQAGGLFQPLPQKAAIPKDNLQTPAKIELGKKLFFDPRLSFDGTISCNSCHNVMASGEDNRPVSVGVHGQKGGRSSPTVWNSAFLSSMFWDARMATLEDQAKGPLTNAVEMAMTDHNMVMERIAKIPGYIKEFEVVFGKSAPALTIDNAAKAIASYERTLITPNSPFDLYLKGDKKALSAEAQRGFKTVQDVGCVSCHQGVNFAGPALPPGTPFLQKFPTFAENDYVAKYNLAADLGRFAATKVEADRNIWRVPTWRNVALTAPYFHNGSVASLDEAVRVMAKTQLNRDLKQQEVTDIVAFLGSLTGEFPSQVMPRLPATPNVSISETWTKGAGI